MATYYGNATSGTRARRSILDSDPYQPNLGAYDYNAAMGSIPKVNDRGATGLNTFIQGGGTNVSVVDPRSDPFIRSRMQSLTEAGGRAGRAAGQNVMRQLGQGAGAGKAGLLALKGISEGVGNAEAFGTEESRFRTGVNERNADRTQSAWKDLAGVDLAMNESERGSLLDQLKFRDSAREDERLKVSADATARETAMRQKEFEAEEKARRDRNRWISEYNSVSQGYANSLGQGGNYLGNSALLARKQTLAQLLGLKGASGISVNNSDNSTSYNNSGSGTQAWRWGD